MKIRRIQRRPQDDILAHCRSYKRHTHKSTVFEVHPISQFMGFARSQRASIDMKILKEKIFNRNQKKKDNLPSNDDTARILAVYAKIKFYYNKLTQMYNTNQDKLTAILVRHIKVEYYLFSKEILEMIRNFRQGKQNGNICFHPQPKKIVHELDKFKQYLQSFYQRKCMKQIQIIEESIMQREQAIRYKTPFQKYQRITKSFRPSLITNNIDICEQFRQMTSQNGSFKQLSKVQNSLFKKLRQTQQKVCRVFQSVCNSKQKNNFLIRVQEIS